MKARYLSLAFRAAGILAVPIFAVSCARPLDVAVSASDAEGKTAALLAGDRNSASGTLATGRPGKLRYSFAEPLPLPPASAVELEYETDAPAPGLLIVFRSEGEASWALPDVPGSAVRYRFPLVGSSLSAFTIGVEKNKAESTAGGPGVKAAARSGFRLKSLRIAERTYGYDERDGALFLTPYVYRERGGSASRLVVDPAASHRPVGPIDLKVAFKGGRSIISAAGTAFAYSGSAKVNGQPSGGPIGSEISIPAGALDDSPFPIVIEGEDYPLSFLAEPKVAQVFPEEAVVADPGSILEYRKDAWRDARYEVFRWERFPQVLIFDTADYAVQDSLFKRIAFYTEKAGFRGRLASDAAIAALHGWNAHDYRAEDLAAFFETARKTDFPLNPEERELLSVLVANGIVKRSGSRDGKIEAGSGAIVSISRESEGYLRSLFMTHECYHGIFFIDADFRAFAGTRWDALDPVARRFLKAYFDMHRYDVADRYLMMNELMAYCLQQPVRGAAKYFGETLPVRVEKDQARRSALPDRDDASGSWPDLARLFSAEAEAFDSYVAERWGLRAGSVSAYQISRTKAAR